MPAAVVQLDGSDVETTYVHPAQLRIDIPEAALASVRAIDITVTSPPPGGGTSLPIRLFVATMPARALPFITGFAPTTATVGQADFTLTIRGWGFGPASLVRWNGEDRVTTHVSSAELRIDVTANDLVAPGAGRITVVDTVFDTESFVGGFPILSSTAPTYSVISVPLRVDELAADPVRDVVYSASTDSIHAFDPFTGDRLWAAQVGRDPHLVHVTDDGSYLYFALSRSAQIGRIDLSSGIRDLVFPIGDDPTLLVQDLTTIPGRPSAVAATLYVVGQGTPRDRGVFIYDDGVKREAVTPPRNPRFHRVEASAWSSRLYGYDAEYNQGMFYRLKTHPTVIAAEAGTDTLTDGYSNDIVYDEGVIFTLAGDIFEPESFTSLGRIAVQGVMEPDVAGGRVYYFEWETLTSVHYSSYTELQSLDVPEGQAPASMVRFGSDGLAIAGQLQLAFVRSDLIGAP